MPEDLPGGGGEQFATLRGMDAGGIVYGVLAVATVIAAEGTRQETFRKLFLASLVTMALYWVAHAYSRHWAFRFDEAVGWSFKAIVVSLVFEASILIGALVPIAVLVIAWIAGASLETAVTAVLWTSAIEIMALEVIPSIRHHLGGKDLLIETMIGVSLGIGILALRLVLH